MTTAGKRHPDLNVFNLVKVSEVLAGLFSVPDNPGVFQVFRPAEPSVSVYRERLDMRLGKLAPGAAHRHVGRAIRPIARHPDHLADHVAGGVAHRLPWLRVGRRPACVVGAFSFWKARGDAGGEAQAVPESGGG